MAIAPGDSDSDDDFRFDPINAGEFGYLQPILDKLPKSLTNDEVDKVTQLLHPNADVFSRHKYDLGCTDLIQVRIPTGDAKAHAEGLRSHPKAYLDLIDQEIQQMLDADIIEPACSSWNANIVCVKKRNGDLRVCVDMRRVNMAHKPFIDKYPLSRIDQCMDALAGKRIFSSLDVFF